MGGPPSAGLSDWVKVAVATEHSLRIKSQESQLIVHRQDVPVFEDLFTRVAELYDEYRGLSAEEICSLGPFQVDCDQIFEDLGPSIWRGPTASWLIKSSDKKYGDASANCYWKKTSNWRTNWYRHYFHELVAVYLANAEISNDGSSNDGPVVSVRCHGGLIRFGKLLTAPTEANQNPTFVRRQGHQAVPIGTPLTLSSESIAKTQAPTKGTKRPSRRGGVGLPKLRLKVNRKRPLVNDDEDDDEPPLQRSKTPKTSSTPTAPAPGSTFNVQGTLSGAALESLSAQQARRASLTEEGLRHVPYAQGIYQLSTQPQSPAHVSNADTNDSLYRLTPGRQRNSRRDLQDATDAQSGPPNTSAATASSGPSGNSGSLAPSNTTSQVPNRATPANSPFDGGLGNNDGPGVQGHDMHDSNIDEVKVKREQGTNAGDAESNPILLDDSEDEEQPDHRNRRTDARAPQTRRVVESQTPAQTSEHQNGSRGSQAMSNGNVFDGRRAWVSWGGQALFDDVVALQGCTTPADFIDRIEKFKHKRPAIRHQKIAAAGVKLSGRPCFRIPWDDDDDGAAFEELKELVNDGAQGGGKVDLKLEIEWEDAEEDEEDPEDGSAPLKDEGSDGPVARRDSRMQL